MRIHYLGHASFVLRFENGVSVLMDYGVSNAYGLASPIFDVSGADPSIVTFSHNHPDHRRPNVRFPQSRVLVGGGTLAMDGLSIRSIRTSETSMEASDNASFVITYGGFTILHLADAQAFISAIDDPVVKRRVKERYPDNYDLVFMTIDGPSEIAGQAATFLDLLAPARAIPMHYWCPEVKADFLTELQAINQSSRAHSDRFTIAETGCSDFSLYADSPPFGTKVITLDPAPLILCPEDSRALEREAHPSAASPSVSAVDSVPNGLAAAPAPPAAPAGEAASDPWHRSASGTLPARRPAAASPCHGYAAAGTPPARRAVSAPSPSRSRPSVRAHTSSDLS
jgi:L-ascorbate metabolism protein UlaG (beta-lactamase superfamily)